jgi:DNA-binding phage protein
MKTQTVIRQHTPERWSVADNLDGQWNCEQGEFMVVDCQDVSIARAYRQPEDPQEWCEANAALIAAAPDLLETLTALLQVVKAAGHSNTERGYETVDYLGEPTLDGKYHVIDGKGINMNFLTNAEEAIAKATGVKQEEDA